MEPVASIGKPIENRDARYATPFKRTWPYRSRRTYMGIVSLILGNNDNNNNVTLIISRLNIPVRINENTLRVHRMRSPIHWREEYICRFVVPKCHNSTMRQRINDNNYEIDYTRSLTMEYTTHCPRRRRLSFFMLNVRAKTKSAKWDSAKTFFYAE